MYVYDLKEASFEILICSRRAKKNLKNYWDSESFGSLEILRKGGCLTLKIHVNFGRNIASVKAFQYLFAAVGQQINLVQLELTNEVYKRIQFKLQ